ncbi:MAG: hypothetical protein WCL04_07585 [Verrucomicrobiota bacterium]
MLSPAADLIERQPVLAFALGGAFAALFLSVVLSGGKDQFALPPPGIWLAQRLARIVWALTLVWLLGGAVLMLRGQVSRTLAEFRHSHGRVTEVNLAAVRTIWGGEQTQGTLAVALGYDEEVTERLESEDPSKPAVLRKRSIRHEMTSNPFVSERHEVTLRQNARPKGSAVYAGYETDCRFVYQLKNPENREVNGTLKFPLPSERAMFNNLEVKLNGASVLDRLQVTGGQLLLRPVLAAGETLTVEIAFKSRGLGFWYFQVREPREIRDFQLTLRLPDLPKDRLNNPEGCMTPTEVSPTADGRGSTLSYRLDHALSNKGMGVAMPEPVQPGATTDAVLAQTEKAWVLVFAAMLLGLTLGAGPHAAALGSVLGGSAAALGYALIADLSDTVIGFWGAYLLVLLPLLLVLGVLLMQTVRGLAGRLIAAELLLFGLLLPTVSGFAASQESLCLNLAALLLLAVSAGQLSQRHEGPPAT